MSMSTMTAKKPATKESTGKVRAVTITVGENGGAVVTCDRESPPRKKGSSCMMDSWQPPKPAPFTTMEEAIHYAAKELGCDISMDDSDEDGK
jgi:hypothetical protein